MNKHLTFRRRGLEQVTGVWLQKYMRKHRAEPVHFQRELFGGNLLVVLSENPDTAGAIPDLFETCALLDVSVEGALEVVEGALEAAIEKEPIDNKTTNKFCRS